MLGGHFVDTADLPRSIATTPARYRPAVAFLKNFVTAFKPSNIKRGLEATRNPVDQAAIEASLATLSPEQRAAYDANMARVAQAEQESMQAWTEAKEIHDNARVLEGPAARWLYGLGMGDVPNPDEINAQTAQKGTWAVV